MTNLLASRFTSILALLLMAALFGCEQAPPSAQGKPANQNKTPIGQNRTSVANQPKDTIREDVRFQISVDTESALRPLVSLPGKVRLPGARQVQSRFRLMVRDPSMKSLYTRLLNDEDVNKKRAWDLNIGPGSYSVALETDDGQGGIIQYSNRVEFEFKKIEPALLKGKDLSRARHPEGLSRFWKSYNTEMVPLEKAEEVLAKARAFEALDVHKDYFFTAIPVAKAKVAAAYCKDGQNEKGMEILQEIGRKGFLPMRLMQFSQFDEVRETEEFQRLFEIAKTETEAESIGPYLVLKEPLFHLRDLLQLETSPPLPTAESLTGSPIIIYTGHRLEKTMLKECVTKQQPVILITNFKPKQEMNGVQVHVADLPARALAVDGTPMIWVADAEGNVVYNQRCSGWASVMDPLHVADYLKLKKKSD